MGKVYEGRHRWTEESDQWRVRLYMIDLIFKHRQWRKGDPIPQAPVLP